MLLLALPIVPSSVFLTTVDVASNLFQQTFWSIVWVFYTDTWSTITIPVYKKAIAQINGLFEFSSICVRTLCW